MSARDDLVHEIDRRLGNRQLYWFGIRGDDARSLSAIPQFSGAFSIINQYSYSQLPYAVAYEDITGVRVDLDSWDIDQHLLDEPTREFRHVLMAAMASDNALVTYRPSQFLSALAFARDDRCQYLGLYADHQHVFEHKPWVETAVKHLPDPIPTLNWHYIADEEQFEAVDILREGSIVVRSSRGSGGSGMARVDHVDSLEGLWPHDDEFFASVSKYLSGYLPLNIGAVVWDDGVTVHQPSVQLIGIPEATRRQFGYCGNDFELAASLDDAIINEVERQTVQVGNWMRSQGFRGAFGLDLLIKGDTVLFTEVNPRFQGSSRLSARLDALCDQPCLFLEHVAAMLHVASPAPQRLRDVVAATPPAAQLVLHNLARSEVTINSRLVQESIEVVDPSMQVEIQPGRSITVDPDGVLAVFRLSHGITATGYDITQDLTHSLTHISSMTNGA